jgi:hypothetical protein
VPAIIE